MFWRVVPAYVSGLFTHQHLDLWSGSVLKAVASPLNKVKSTRIFRLVRAWLIDSPDDRVAILVEPHARFLDSRARCAHWENIPVLGHYLQSLVSVTLFIRKNGALTFFVRSLISFFHFWLRG